MFRNVELYNLLRRKHSWSVWAVFTVSIILILLFQSVWLYNVYRLKQQELEDIIVKELQRSIDKELEVRRLESNESLTFISGPPDVNIGAQRKLNTDEVSESGIFQQLLPLTGFPFELSTLDSIFRTKLIENEISATYLLCYTDSTGNIIDQAGDVSLIDKKDIFQSVYFLIVNGKRVSVRMDISLFVVSDRMAWLLLGSFFMLLLIVACFIYQTKTVFNRQKLNQLREDFTNALTHNMKTPLSTIHTVLQQLMGNQLNDLPEIKEQFGIRAMNQVHMLRTMIDQLLTTAKFDHGKMTLTCSNVDLATMINELTARFLTMTNKTVIFRTAIDLQNASIYLDGSLLENAISNLIENAIKYSNDPVHILITCTIKDKRLFVSIKDDGYGIHRKYRKKIFRKYERGEATFRKGASGFGLGLNFVKSVVKSHGGIVKLNSISGKGSEFMLEIPLKNEN